MLNDKPMYAIYLEDYSLPRYLPRPKAYIGTMNEIEDFMFEVSQISWPAERYADLIEMIIGQDWDPNATHTVSGKHLKLYYYVREVYRNEFRLEEPNWDYSAFSGSSYPMSAKSADVSQVLLQWGDNRYCRCTKVSFDELMIRTPGVGWTMLAGDIKGFPATYYTEDTKYIPRLYTIQQVYTAAQLDQAIADMSDFDTVDLSIACQDILGVDIVTPFMSLNIFSKNLL